MNKQAGPQVSFSAAAFFPGYWDVHVFDATGGEGSEDVEAFPVGVELEQFAVNLTAAVDSGEGSEEAYIVLRGSKVSETTGDVDVRGFSGWGVVMCAAFMCRCVWVWQEGRAWLRLLHVALARLFFSRADGHCGASGREPDG